MRQIAWAFTFLVFDREAGQLRPAPITGVVVLALAVGSHLWLSGSWMEQAGFPAAATTPATTRVLPPPTSATTCRTEASR